MWYATLIIDDDSPCSDFFFRKYDLPDYITGAPTTNPMQWSKAVVQHDAVSGRDYIHVVGTEGNTTGGSIDVVCYERCYMGGNDTLICQAYESGSTKTYKMRPNVAGGGSFSPIGFFDSSCSITIVPAVSPVSKRAALAWIKPAKYGATDYGGDVAYMESQNLGDEWLGGTYVRNNLTDFGLTGSERAYNDLSACYDYQDSLHIVYVTCGFDPTNPGYYDPHEARLYHWSKKTGVSIITDAIWEGTAPGAHCANIAKMSMGALDPIYHPGGDSVYLYTIWTQFDTADNSAAGYTNGEIYGCGSYDGGNTWGGVYNLTNTKTPNCAPGTCVSEHWSSLAQNMYNGDLHIQYICDLDAGGSVMGEGQWMNVPVMYLRLSGWEITPTPRGSYRIEEPAEWYGPPLKITPNGTRTLRFKIYSIGNTNLTFSVSTDDACIQCNVNPASLLPRDSVTIAAVVSGAGACNGTFIDGNVILTTDEGGGKTEYLPVQAVVADDYYECPNDPETYETLENGVLRLYANANGQIRIYDIGTRPDTSFEVFYNGGTIIATTQSGDTLVGRYMGQNDQHAGARDRLHLEDYGDYWTLSTENVFIHDLNPPMNPRWWWWEMSTRIVFFKSYAEDDLKHVVIEYVTVERRDSPNWWPTHPTFTGYEDTYIGLVFDIDCPADTMGTETGRNLAGYDEVNNITWQRGWDNTGAHPEYNDYYAGIALANGGQPGESEVPYGTYNVRNDQYLYPQDGWGWKDQELYQLVSTPGNHVQDPDSVEDRSSVVTAGKIPEGTNADLKIDNQYVIGGTVPSLTNLDQIVKTARVWIWGQIIRPEVYLKEEPTNFNLKNFTDENVNDFHLQLSGVKCSDLLYIYKLGWSPTCSDIPGGAIITWTSTTPLPPTEWKHFGYVLQEKAPQSQTVNLEWTLDGQVVGMVPIVEQGWEAGTQGKIKPIVRHRPKSGDIVFTSPVYVQRKYAHTSEVIPLDSLNPGNPMVESLPWILIDTTAIPLLPGDSLVYEIQTFLADTAILMRYTVMDSVMNPFAEYINEAEISGIPPQFIRGDANGDGVIDVGDVVYLINYLFKNGPAPYPLEAGDANSDSVVDIGDVVYLINYLFKNGPPPGN